MEQHNDFGEKIGGARKDLWKNRDLIIDDLKHMNDREAEKFVKKSNVWKTPNYQAMLDNGTPLGVVYFMKKVRDSVSASPQYSQYDNTPEKYLSRQKEYIQTIKELQAAMTDIYTITDAMQVFDRFLINNGYVMVQNGRYSITKKGYSNPVITNKLLKVLMVQSVPEFTHKFIEKAKTDQFLVPKEQKVPSGYKIRFYDESKTSTKRDTWTANTWYVTKGFLVLQTNFKSKDEAVKWAQNHVKENRNRKKDRFTQKTLDDIRRTGPDFRSGQDITGQDYLDTFGFRGGEFGNWLNQTERQEALNMGFDALKDLASVLQITDQDISYQGNLALAFGARGIGNAAAHYEPLRQVINLTKLHGAGSLAHEWWHGLDDYLGKQFGANGLLSNDPCHYALFRKLLNTIKYKTETNEQAATRVNTEFVRLQKNAESWLVALIEKPIENANNKLALKEYMRLKTKFLSGENDVVEKLNMVKKAATGRVIPKKDREHLERFGQILRNAKTAPSPRQTETDYYQNSKTFGKSYGKDGGYWDSNEELTARAFACYIKDRLTYRSDYLVGHAESAITAEIDSNGDRNIRKAFPEGEERSAINAVFDELFIDLKERNLLHLRIK